MLRTIPLRRYFSTRAEPLRILFCGSDDFSIASLRALHEYTKSSSQVASIDVLSKTDKPAGRGLKKLKPPLIKSVAQELGLPLHQINSFSGWNLPSTYVRSDSPHINLIVAVSFGLLIPASIISSTKYGGLNVHPSLLPRLRGAAPLNWAIINGDTHTGVSLQTLHPSKFDAGMIIAQTPKIAIPENVTINALRDQLAPVGANLLVQAIQKKLYLEPKPIQMYDQEVTLAPKIISDFKVLRWQQDDIQLILRKNRAIPKLWMMSQQKTKAGIRPVRILFGGDLRIANNEDVPSEIREEIISRFCSGTPLVITKNDAVPSQHELPVLLVINSEILAIPRMLVAGQAERAASVAASAGGLLGKVHQVLDYRVHSFHEPLTVEQLP